LIGSISIENATLSADVPTDGGSDCFIFYAAVVNAVVI